MLVKSNKEYECMVFDLAASDISRVLQMQSVFITRAVLLPTINVRVYNKAVKNLIFLFLELLDKTVIFANLDCCRSYSGWQPIENWKVTVRLVKPDSSHNYSFSHLLFLRKVAVNLMTLKCRGAIELLRMHSQQRCLLTFATLSKWPMGYVAGY